MPGQYCWDADYGRDYAGVAHYILSLFSSNDGIDENTKSEAFAYAETPSTESLSGRWKIESDWL